MVVGKAVLSSAQLTLHSVNAGYGADMPPGQLNVTPSGRPAAEHVAGRRVPKAGARKH